MTDRIRWTCPFCNKTYAVPSIEGLTACPACQAEDAAYVPPTAPDEFGNSERIFVSREIVARLASERPTPLLQRKIPDDVWRAITTVAIAVVGICFLIGFVSPSQKTQAPKDPDRVAAIATLAVEERVSQAIVPAQVATVPVLPGLMLADVYLNLEDFKRVGPKHVPDVPGWPDAYLTELSNQPHPAVNLRVTISGPTPSSVNSITATLLNASTADTGDLATPFLGYLTTLPYRGADPLSAREWLDLNIDQPVATTSIGQARFELTGKEHMRMLRITAIR